MTGDADFINCVFNAENTAEMGYAVYGRGSCTLTITDCTFKTDGRAIMLYGDHPTGVNVVLTRCTFSDNGRYTDKDKAVVETGNDPSKNSKFTITINDCKITQGFEENNSNSPFWGNKDKMDSANLKSTIDGVDMSKPRTITFNLNGGSGLSETEITGIPGTPLTTEQQSPDTTSLTKDGVVFDK